MNVQTMNESVTRINSLASSRQQGKERIDTILITWIKLPIDRATYHKMDSQYTAAQLKKEKEKRNR
jgi:hypothetical protein